MKLNYTSLQHAVRAGRATGYGEEGERCGGGAPPVLVIAAPRPPRAGGVGRGRGPARAADRLRADARAAPCPAGCRATSSDLARAWAARGARDRRARPTAASTRRSAWSAPSTPRRGALGWDAIVAGPGRGILGSATRYGHGGMAALEAAHAGPRAGAADARLAAALELRSAAAPPRAEPPHRVGARACCWPRSGSPVPEVDAERAGRPEGRGERPDRRALDALIEPARDRHDIAVEPRRPRRLRGPAGCRRRRWAATSTRTRCSSPRRWRPGGRWRRRSG